VEWWVLLLVGLVVARFGVLVWFENLDCYDMGFGCHCWGSQFGVGDLAGGYELDLMALSWIGFLWRTF